MHYKMLRVMFANTIVQVSVKVENTLFFCLNSTSWNLLCFLLFTLYPLLTWFEGLKCQCSFWKYSAFSNKWILGRVPLQKHYLHVFSSTGCVCACWITASSSVWIVSLSSDLYCCYSLDLHPNILVANQTECCPVK